MNRSQELALERLSPFELKDKLLALAADEARRQALPMLNAGRGNPNWIAATPRDAFFTLGQFGMAEARRTFHRQHLAGMPEPVGIAGRFAAWADAHPDAPGLDLLRAGITFAVDRFGFAADKLVYELRASHKISTAITGQI